jgi:hypothetical protein
MIAVKTLQKRLDKLEERPTTEPDIVEMVLAASEDDDLLLLQELSSLRESGFDEEQTASMMGDRYHEALNALVHFQEAYRVIIDASKDE